MPEKADFAHSKNDQMKKLFLLLAPALLILGSCRFMGKRVRGNGNIKTEERTVSAFKNVEVNGAVNLTIVQGALKPVQLECDDNILPLIEVRQDGDRITIRTKDGYNIDPSADLNVTVTAPVYNHIESNGASDIKSTAKIVNPEKMEIGASGAGEIEMELDAPAISTSISGSGSIKLKGQTKDFDIDLTGAGHAYCFDLLSETTKVQISGVGSAEVYASVSVDAEVSGVGHVKYKGNAPNVKQQVSGAGSVEKAE